MPLEKQGIYRFGEFRLEPEERLLLRNGQPVSLSPKAFDTLLLLVRNSGHVLSRSELMETLWPNTFVEENNLTQNIAILRRALGNGSGDGQSYIATVPRLGYRFVYAVEKVEGSNGQGETDGRQRSGAEIAEPLGASSTAQVKEARSVLAKNKWFSGPRLAIVSGVLILLALALGYQLSRPRVPVVVDSHRVARVEGFNELFATETDLYSLFYFNGRQSLMRQPIGGTAPTEISTPIVAPSLEDFSRTRSEFLVLESGGTVERPLWILPVPSGSPRRVGNVEAHTAGWSADGQRIVYASGNDLFIANRDGGDVHKLAANVGWAIHLRWSPDGSVIRYTARDEGTALYALWEVSASGSTPERLVTNENNGGELGGEWSCDGKYYFFVRGSVDRSDIWALGKTPPALASFFLGNANIRPLQVSRGPAALFWPQPTADGKKLLAIARIDKSELVRYDAPTRTYQPFLNGTAGDGVAFSHNGQWAAYVSFPERELWRSRTDGSDRQQLTFAPAVALMPRWSPDGKSIAYVGKEPDKPRQIYVVSAQGGSPRALVPGKDDQANPAWSPDGHSLAFAGVPWMRGWDPGSTAVHVVDLRTSQVGTLPGSEGLWSPRWSPDGRWMVAESIDSKRLLLYNFVDRRWRTLVSADSPRYVGYSAWSHDSRYVYFNWVSLHDAPIYRAAVNGGPAELVLQPDAVRLKNTLSTWFGLTPDDQILLLRDRSAEEVYAFTLEYR